MYIYSCSVRSETYFRPFSCLLLLSQITVVFKMREIVHVQAGQCGNQIGAKVSELTWDR